MTPLALALVAWIAVASIATFALTLFDKARARTGRARVRERTLLLWALFGGSPGLAAGMLVARHKTRKASFIARFAIVLAAQGVLALASLGWRP